MALAAVKITVGTDLGGGQYGSSINGGSVPNIATAVTDVATLVADNVAVTPVENAVATLEADGATPTQAHVTALRGVWNTLSAACTAHNGDANAMNVDVTAINAALSGDVVVIWNGSVVTHRNQLRAALRLALRAVDGGIGGLAE